MGTEGSDDFTQQVGNVVIPTFFKKEVWMLAKAKNGHANIRELFKLNLWHNITLGSPKQDSEKNMVLCKKR
jgi:hypothetical protein